MTNNVILGGARTPVAKINGTLASKSGVELGAVAIRAAVERAGIAPDAVQEVIMGCCLMAGQGQAPARQAALGAGLPPSAAERRPIRSQRFPYRSLNTATRP